MSDGLVVTGWAGGRRGGLRCDVLGLVLREQARGCRGLRHGAQVSYVAMCWVCPRRTGESPIMVDPQVSSSPTREEVIAELRRLWQAMTGRPPASLTQDIAELDGWFGAKVSGDKLRERIEQLTLTEAHRARLPALSVSLTLCAAGGVVVTPEGRLALELLSDGLDVSELDVHVVRSDPISDAYRRWSRERLADVIDELEGRGKPMYPVAIAAALVLALNGSDHPDRALRLPSERAAPALYRALKRPLDKFADTLEGSSSQRNTAQFTAYPVAHAKMRLGRAVRRARRGSARIWLDPDVRDWALDVLVDELVRRHELTPAHASRALDALWQTYERNRTALAERAVAFSSGEQRAQLRQDLAVRCSRDPEELRARALRVHTSSSPGSGVGAAQAGRSKTISRSASGWL